jgi:hypothetical protein
MELRTFRHQYWHRCSRDELWAARLASIEKREQRIREVEGRLASEGTDAR